MTRFILIGVLAVFVSGCASNIPREKLQVAINSCPVLKQYSKEQLTQAASELQNLPSGSQLSVLLADYSKLRDACRVAERKLKRMYP
jgi:uncharacterized lipoprotein YbaY